MFIKFTFIFCLMINASHACFYEEDLNNQHTLISLLTPNYVDLPLEIKEKILKDIDFKTKDHLILRSLNHFFNNHLKKFCFHFSFSFNTYNDFKNYIEERQENINLNLDQITFSFNFLFSSFGQNSQQIKQLCSGIRNLEMTRQAYEEDFRKNHQQKEYNPHGARHQQLKILGLLTNLCSLDLSYTVKPLTKAEEKKYGCASFGLHYLESLTNLKRLFVRGNAIDQIYSLQKLTNLQFLDLGNNRIGVGNIAILARLPKLKSLNLYLNVIQDHDIQIIQKHLTVLTELDISSNLVGEIGARALLNHPSLIKLNLKYNLPIKNNTSQKLKEKFNIIENII